MLYDQTINKKTFRPITFSSAPFGLFFLRKRQAHQPATISRISTAPAMIARIILERRRNVLLLDPQDQRSPSNDSKDHPREQKQCVYCWIKIEPAMIARIILERRNCVFCWIIRISTKPAMIARIILVSRNNVSTV